MMLSLDSGLRRVNAKPTTRSLAAAILGATALTAPFATSPAAAQNQSAEAIGNQAIIVTAQRREEALEDVPMTVTVLNADTLEAAGASSVRDLANVTSGYQLTNAGSIPQPAIRGITTINAGSYENNVAVFIDGLYQVVPAALNIDLPNVSNVQILKGPQGTLYGRNATGGALLIETISPSDEWQGKAELTYGRFDDKRASGYVAGPISDTIGISLAGYIRDNDGYYKLASRIVPGEFDGRTFGLRQESIRAKLSFEPTDNFRATLGYNYTLVNDPRGVMFTTIENVPRPYTPGTGRETAPSGLGETAYNLEPVVDFDQHEAFLKLELDTGIGTLKSLTAYTRGWTKTDFDFDGSYEPRFFFESDVRDRMWQQAVDLTIDSIDGFDLILGGTYYHIKTDYPVLYQGHLGPAQFGIPYPDPGVAEVPLSDYINNRHEDFERTKKAWAVFADATFHVTDKLSISAGGRYSEEKQDVFSFQENLDFPTFFGTGESIYVEAYSLNRSSSYSKFTPRASIRYEITPRTSIYASYSKGFRSGEWNTRPATPTFYEDVGQESVDAFEVGLKSAGSRLRFEVAGFYYDYTDLQVSFTAQDPDSGTAIVILQNAPSAEIYGIEGSFDYEVVENFNIRGGATWLHARYGDNFLFSGSGVNPLAPGFNEHSDPLKELQNITVNQDLSGLQMSRAPDFTAYLGFDFLIPNGDGGLRFAANAKYTDSYVVTNPSVWGGWVEDDTHPLYVAELVGDNRQILTGTGFEDRANEQRARQGNYVLINASITWTDPTDSYYVRLWGNNLTDQKYRSHYNPLGSGTYSPIGEPLTYGVTIGYKFNGG